jgi:hypothetical protein
MKASLLANRRSIVGDLGRMIEGVFMAVYCLTRWTHVDLQRTLGLLESSHTFAQIAERAWSRRILAAGDTRGNGPFSAYGHSDVAAARHRRAAAN